MFAGVDAGAGTFQPDDSYWRPTSKSSRSAGRRQQAGWRLARAALRLTGGLPFETTVDATVLELIQSLDGRPFASYLASRPLRQRPESVAVARVLLELGFLVQEP